MLPAALTQRRDPLVFIRQEVGSAPRLDLDAVRKRSYLSPPEIGPRLFGRPVRSSVYTHC
jgi:hypothetical protein